MMYSVTNVMSDDRQFYDDTTSTWMVLGPGASVLVSSPPRSIVSHPAFTILEISEEKQKPVEEKPLSDESAPDSLGEVYS